MNVGNVLIKKQYDEDIKSPCTRAVLFYNFETMISSIYKESIKIDFFFLNEVCWKQNIIRGNSGHFMQLYYHRVYSNGFAINTLKTNL